MSVSNRRGSVQMLLIGDLVAERIDDLHREAAAARLAATVRGPSLASRAATRGMDALGFWLMGAGLRLATAGATRGNGHRLAGGR
jgi:hypothetical protein